MTPDGIHFSLSCLAEGEGKHSKPVANHSMTTAVALFDKTGDLIYMGQSKGSITVLDSASLKFLDIVKVGTQPPCANRVCFSCLVFVSTHKTMTCLEACCTALETRHPDHKGVVRGALSHQICKMPAVHLQRVVCALTLCMYTFHTGHVQLHPVNHVCSARICKAKLGSNVSTCTAWCWVSTGLTTLFQCSSPLQFWELNCHVAYQLHIRNELYMI